MPIAIGNKRLPVTLDEKRQKELIALDLLIAKKKQDLRYQH
ncbi:hypothetical protein [Enterococcus lactis]|nr:hypothetical protein [Enterococcus lactis]